ncbi:MAG: bifunctional oligoribonuclease/PAP phosphatase NrnA [Chlorobiales bacterium]|nr:bifunctional oligoribonuclease/PAP phosphatase NrnA [Chlorobiales bacterium]
MVKLITRADSVVLCTHEYSDGDGLGSQVALYEALRQLDRRVTIVNPTDVPANYNFLKPLDDVIVFDSSDDMHIQLIEKADLFILLDANHLSRTRKIGHHVIEARRLSGLKIACIDHHLDQQEFADEMICVSTAAATGQLVFELIKVLEARFQKSLINKAAAMGLYTAIMTDTGSFRFPKTSPRVHRIVAELLEKGIEPMKIYEHVYSTMTPEALKLIGTAVNNVKMLAENKAAYICITRRMFEETGAQNSDTERLTDYLMAIPTVRAAMMFVEQENGTTKLSLRSKGNVRVNELAKKFGGGGHRNAAGCIVPFPPEKAIALATEHVLPLLGT